MSHLATLREAIRSGSGEWNVSRADGLFRSLGHQIPDSDLARMMIRLVDERTLIWSEELGYVKSGPGRIHE